MKISPIKLCTNGTFKNQTKQSSNSAKNQLNFKSSTHNDFYVDLYGEVRVDEKAINLLGGDAAHLSEVAEVLRTTDDDVIQQHYAQCRTFGFKNKRKSAKAYDRLMPYVNAARQKYAYIQDRLHLLYTLVETNNVFNSKIIELEKEAKRMDDVANTTDRYRNYVYDGTGDGPDPEEEAKFWDAMMH